MTPRGCDTHLCCQAGFEVSLHVGHSDSVLRSFGATAARHHGGQIQTHHLREEETG